MAENRNHRFYATCPWGLEKLLEAELAGCGAKRMRPTPSGVLFEGTMEAGYLACLRSRVASRVLLEAAFHDYYDSRDIYALARSTPWEEYFGLDQTFRVSISAKRAPLKSLEFTTLRIKDGICDRFRDVSGSRPDVGRGTSDVQVAAFLDQKYCTLYIDLAGEALFKRGWRTEKGEAPLKENLASGLLMLSGWDASKPLIDPFCGSGTIAIEAASIACGIAPGLSRSFAFERLLGFDRSLWTELREDAKSEVNLHAPVRIDAGDISSIVVKKAEANALRAGLGALLEDGRLTFSVRDARELEPLAGEPGVIVANPPYGEQSNPRSATVGSMMRKVADNLKKRFPGWTAWLLTSDRHLPGEMHLKESRKTVLFNGPLECRFFRFDLVAGSNRRVRKSGEESDGNLGKAV
ncbi:MAG: THUMP domain-containing protein [Sutterellaceae bacterium]|nr:THUMP domain-containing protein [Sutterellaceae bacterium]MDD7442504.1 THUMP domain-containing protein [Sutterellaceae bacterium]MDY2869229.1 THUMP domain-containing protein [Mesosutterella sp.]